MLFEYIYTRQPHCRGHPILLTKTYGLKNDCMSMTYLYDEGTMSYRGSTGNIKEKEKKKTVNYSRGKENTVHSHTERTD